MKTEISTENRKKNNNKTTTTTLGMCTQSTIESEWSSTKLFAGRMKCKQQ